MNTILGPYVYRGVAFTESETRAPLSSYLDYETPVYIKITHADTLQSVYLDLFKIATFDRKILSMTAMGIVAFLNAWYVPSPNQKGLETQYANTTVLDVPDSIEKGMIYSFNPILEPTLTVQQISINAPEKTSPEYIANIKNDLVISGDRDLSNVLIFINGVLHNSIYWNRNRYVIDAMYSFRQNQRFDIQCYDTTPVGGHTVIPLTADMCAWDADQAGIILTLPSGTSFTGKSVFVTIDGYLYHPGEILSVKNATMAFLHTARIPFISQWRHNPLTKRKADTVGANWTWGTPSDQPNAPPVVTGGYRSINQQPDLELMVGKRAVPRSQLITPDFKWNRITSPHSAIILVNKEILNHEVIYPYPIQVTGRYGLSIAKFPQGISRYGCGLSPSYVTTTGHLGETWIHINQPDYDLDRGSSVLNPTGITSLFPQIDDSLHIPFRIHVFS